MTPIRRKEDTWVDTVLDFLRDASYIPLEGALAWCVAILCWLYYGILYHWAKLSWRRHPAKIPLVTLVSSDLSSANTESLYEQLREKLPTSASLRTTSVRNDQSLRRLLSLFMQQSDADSYYPIHHELQSQWLEFLQVPAQENISKASSSSTSTCSISVILPAYREPVSVLMHTLQHAKAMCADPSRVQIIIVQAGTQSPPPSTTADDKDITLMALSKNGWKDLQVVYDTSGGGRGPALNCGAAHADKGSSIFTFLHADTLLPHYWDVQIAKALSSSSSTACCAFRFGHHGAAPAGLRAVQWLGNRRALDYQLPYGDHVLSFSAAWFHRLGGFPHQPIMEDYDLMHLLRQHGAVLPNTSNDEHLLCILDGVAQCSTRRWEQYGVVYVTLVNALLVHRYTVGDWTAEDIFDYYYCRQRKATNEKKEA